MPREGHPVGRHHRGRREESAPQHPKEDGQDKTNQKTRDDGEIKREAFPADHDVPRQAPEPEFRQERPQEPGEQDDKPQADKEARYVHFPALSITGLGVHGRSISGYRNLDGAARGRQLEGPRRRPGEMVPAAEKNVTARLDFVEAVLREKQHDVLRSKPARLDSVGQSLDGYVDHLEMRTGPALFRHWIEHVRDLAGCVYGRRMYEVMRYWDEDDPEWSAERREFVAAWRRQPKWVVSRSLKSVGETLRGDSIGSDTVTSAVISPAWPRFCLRALAIAGRYSVAQSWSAFSGPLRLRPRSVSS